MKLLFRYHFFIKVVDKVVAMHLMQWGKIYLLQEASSHHLGPPSLILALPNGSSRNAILHPFPFSDR